MWLREWWVYARVLCVCIMCVISVLKCVHVYVSVCACHTRVFIFICLCKCMRACMCVCMCMLYNYVCACTCTCKRCTCKITKIHILMFSLLLKPIKLSFEEKWKTNPCSFENSYLQNNEDTYFDVFIIIKTN